MNEKIEDLRSHLFDTIKGLKDKTIDLERANAIAGVAQVIINSAKAEVEYLKVTGAKKGTGFITSPQLEGEAHPKLALGGGDSGYTGKLNKDGK